MRVCIIGAGNTGQAIAVYLKSQGCECILNTRSKEKAEVITHQGITSQGAITGQFIVPATTDLQQAVKDADLIVIMTVANAHREVALRLKPLLEPGQRILIFNSNWGAFEFKQVFRGDINKKNLTVAETNAQLFLASTREGGVINIGIKERVSVSATNPSQTQPLLDYTRIYFPQFQFASSIIETTMASTNPVIHVPITLLNLARIENKQRFLFYGEGVSHAAVKLILNIDKERVAIAKALGCQIADVLTSINSFWEIKHDNLYDALTKNQSYVKGFGPMGFTHRYLTEDVPYGILPIAQIGDLIDVDTPYTDAVINVLYHTIDPQQFCGGVDFRMDDFRLN